MSERSKRPKGSPEQGAGALAAFAGALTEAEWETRVPKDGHKIGVMVASRRQRLTV